MRNMTWGDLKKLVEAAGVTDDQEIEYIDIIPAAQGEVDVHIAKDKTFSVS